MGQYHRIYNLTKKETFSPHKLGNGAKLLEWGCGGAYVAGMAVLLCNSNGRGGGDLNVHHDYNRGEDGKYILTDKQRADSMAVERIAGRWAGDKIVVQGDYAEKGDAAFISEQRLKGFKDISDLVIEALSVDAYIKSEFLGK